MPISDLISKYRLTDDDDDLNVAPTAAKLKLPDAPDDKIDLSSISVPQKPAQDGDVLTQALLGLAPLALGAAVGGLRGGAIGGQVGSQALDDYKAQKIAQAKMANERADKDRDFGLKKDKNDIDRLKTQFDQDFKGKQLAETQSFHDAEKQNFQDMRRLQERGQNLKDKEYNQRQEDLNLRKDQAADDKTNKRFTEFSQYLDPSKGRAGEFGNQLQKANAADRILVLADQNPSLNFSRNQMTELAAATAALITNGSHPAEATIHAMTPSTVGGDIAKLTDWLTSKPNGAQQQAFAKQMLETATREKKLAMSKVRDYQFQRVGAYSDLRGKDEARFKGVLRDRGIDPDEYEQFLKNGGKPEQIVDALKAGASDGSGDSDVVQKIMAANPGVDQATARQLGVMRGLIK